MWETYRMLKRSGLIDADLGGAARAAVDSRSAKRVLFIGFDENSER